MPEDRKGLAPLGISLGLVHFRIVNAGRLASHQKENAPIFDGVSRRFRKAAFEQGSVVVNVRRDKKQGVDIVPNELVEGQVRVKTLGNIGMRPKVNPSGILLFRRLADRNGDKFLRFRINQSAGDFTDGRKLGKGLLSFLRKIGELFFKLFHGGEEELEMRRAALEQDAKGGDHGEKLSAKGESA